MSNPPNDGTGAPAGADGAAAAAAAAAAGGSGQGVAGGAGADGQGAGTGNAFAAAAASGADAGAAAAGGAAAAAVVPLADRIPEKYRVLKEDGTLDLEASTGKLVDAHGSLEKRLGTGEAPPKSPEDYAPKADGFDFEALKGDEQYQSFLKGAHARGINNETLSWILGEYASREAQAGAAGGGMSTADFEADMRANHWKEPGEYEKNMGLGLKAIRAYAPDITAEELAAIPNSPAIARILAKVGAEVGEDRTPRVETISEGDFDSQLAAIQADPAYTDANHPQHKELLAKAENLFKRRFPPKAATT